MSDRDATEALIRRYVAAFNEGDNEGMLDVGRERQAPVTTRQNQQGWIARLVLG